MLTIEPATSDDLSCITEMGHAFFKEAGWADVAEWEDVIASQALSNLLDNENFIFLIARQDGDVMGMAGGLIFPMWFNPKVLMSQEFFWYVKPHARTGIGLKLYNALEERFKERGVDVFSMIAVSKLPSLEKFYIRKGFRQSEQTYIKRLV